MEDFKLKREKVYAMLDRNCAKSTIMRELNLKVHSYNNYKSAWKKDKVKAEAAKMMGIPKTELEEQLKDSKIETKKYILVDIVLADGTLLEDCGVFKSEDGIPKNGSMPLQKDVELKEAFQKVPWGQKVIYFQNKFINGWLHVNNVKEYTPKAVEA